MVVNTEVLNSNSQRVAQSYLDHQDFAAGEVRTNVFHWVPTQPGEYTVKISVFSSTGAVDGITVDDARTFNVGAAGPSPSPAPVGHQITGRLVDGNGAGISGEVLYTIRRPGDDVSPSRPLGTITDANGYFTLQNLTDGLNYFLTPDMPGYYGMPRDIRFENLNGDRTANFTVKQSPPALAIFTEPNSDRAVNLASATFLAGSFSTLSTMNLSADQRTRLMIFVSKLALPPGETFAASDIKVIEDAPSLGVWPAVETFGAVPNQPGLSFVIVTLPDDPNLTGDVWIKLSFLGTFSNRARITIKPR